MGHNLTGFFIIISLAALAALQAPPRVLKFTIDHKDNVADVQRDADVSLRCTATGNSPYQLSLLHDQGGKQTLKTVSSSEVSHSLKATCHSMGRYTCLAENSAQQKDLKHVNLRVRCAPVYCLTTKQVPQIGIALGSNKTVKICVLAYPAPTFISLYGGTVLDRFTVQKSSFEAGFNYIDETTGWAEITLTLFSVEQKDFRKYNLYSEVRPKSGVFPEVHSFLQFNLLEIGLPSCPENLTVSATFPDSINLSWKPGFDGGVQQSFTILRYDSGLTTEPQTVSVIPQPAGSLEDEMSYNVTGLSESTAYTFGLWTENEEGVTECGLRVQGSTLASPLSSSDQSFNILTIIVMIAVLVLVLVITVVAFVFVLVGRRLSRGVLNTDNVQTATSNGRPSSRNDEQNAYETANDKGLSEEVSNSDTAQTPCNGRPSNKSQEQNAYETSYGGWLSEEVSNSDTAQTPASNGRPSNKSQEQNGYETPYGGWLPEEEKQKQDALEKNNEEAVYLSTQNPNISNTVEGADKGVVYANAAASDNIREDNTRARDGGGASNYDCLTLTEDAFDDDGTYTKIKVDQGPAGRPQSEGVNVTEKSLYIDVL